MLIPFGLVILLALRRHAILVALTWGIVIAAILGLLSGQLAPQQLISFDQQNDSVGGALVSTRWRSGTAF